MSRGAGYANAFAWRFPALRAPAKRPVACKGHPTAPETPCASNCLSAVAVAKWLPSMATI